MTVFGGSVFPLADGHFPLDLFAAQEQGAPGFDRVG